MRKGKFSWDDDTEEFNGYSEEDSNWNGWAQPIFTADELIKVFHPYNVQFSFTEDCIPVAMVKMEDSTEIMESSPIWDEEKQEFLVGYAPEGFCFVDVE